MKLQGDYTFDAPQDLVWEALQDPAVLGSVMPGGQAFEEYEENKYKGKLTVKVGPVQGVFNAKIELEDVNPIESYTIKVDGQGTSGYVKATGGMNLDGRGEQTYMEYAGTAQISGRIASVGQRLIDSTAKSIVRQALTGLNEYLKLQVSARDAQQTSHETAEASETAQAKPAKPAPQVVYKPPSETEVAFRVAQDVFDDSVRPSLQPWIIIGAGTIIAVTIFLIFGV